MSQTSKKNVRTNNSRRHFLTAVISTAAVVATASTTGVMASSGTPAMVGIVYTKENPGKWAKKVAGHLPSIKVAGNKVTIETDHGMSKRHYIVRHTLVSEDGKVLGDKNFTPDDDALSTYTLPDGYKGKIFATSFCNKHDLWLAETQV